MASGSRSRTARVTARSCSRLDGRAAASRRGTPSDWLEEPIRHDDYAGNAKELSLDR